MPGASGPIASARVVSSVTSRIEGRASACGAEVPGAVFEQAADPGHGDDQQRGGFRHHPRLIVMAAGPPSRQALRRGRPAED